MALAKHEFIDDYPYLVYTNEQTIVYSDKADTSIDDIGGGGGGGDITIANVTVSCTQSGNYGMLYSVAADPSETFSLEAGTLPSVLQPLDLDLSTEAQTFEVYMYQGNALFSVYMPERVVTLTGNATKHEYGSDEIFTIVTITGDCTIVVTPD